MEVPRVLADAPTEVDELGRDRYVGVIAGITRTAETPYVIAIYGPWGSGKTSLMRQIRRRLEPKHDAVRTAHPGGDLRTIWFDPWLHQFDQAPAVALLHAAMEQLGLQSRVDVRETLKRVALALTEDFKIPYLGLQLGKLAKIRSEIANDEFNRREEQARLRKRFSDAFAVAGTPDIRLVFFIDDLDRCHPRKTVQILEALKLYLDVEGCVYVLGVDREPLEAAIRTEYGDLDIAASSYLDKIVQLPFALPAITEDAMRRFVESKMPDDLRVCTEILVTAGADDPRQVKRILNSLYVNDRLVGEELTDYQPQVLIALILIQNLVPELDRLVRLNPLAFHDLLLGPDQVTPGSPPERTLGTPSHRSVDEDASEASVAHPPSANLWSRYIAPLPRLAAALRLVTVPAELDLRPYLTLTAAASPQISEVASVGEAPPVRFFGLGEFTGFLDVGIDQLDSLSATARGVLRQLVDDAPPDEPTDVESVTGRLLRQLPRLAIVGYRIYSDLASGLVPEEAQKLAEQTRTPALIPIAAASRTTKTLPAAILYDRPIDPAISASEFLLCPTFGQALAEGTELGETPCWQGDCPSIGDPRIVCASGFWGFRHALGHPYASDDLARDQSKTVTYEEDPDIVLAIASDPEFGGTKHVANLAELASSWPSTHWYQASDRSQLMEILERVEPHLFYLCGRGADQDRIPGVAFGSADDAPLQPMFLKGLRWTNRRPIVMINSGFGPDGLGEFARVFLASGASGVIGMEVPIRARDAVPFAELLLLRLIQGREVGWVIRDARLDMLRVGNPLPISYIGLIDPSLRLERSSVAASA